MNIYIIDILVDKSIPQYTFWIGTVEWGPETGLEIGWASHSLNTLPLPGNKQKGAGYFIAEGTLIWAQFSNGGARIVPGTIP